MTENQEKQIFKILNNLVISVNAIREELNVIKADIDVIKADIVEIKADIVEIKADIVEIRADIVEIRADIAEIRGIQTEQGESLRRMEVKTDSIAAEVADNGRRIDALERRTEQRVH
ncbi:MAG: hypothetical protein IPJ30_11830 [Acidobacteria bacterium]|nr:hypothetical protein [Acidobacteriota bacterium]